MYTGLTESPSKIMRIIPTAGNKGGFVQHAEAVCLHPPAAEGSVRAGGKT